MEQTTSEQLYSLAGIWQVGAEDGEFDMKIPGILDESNIGHKDRKELENAPLFGPKPYYSALDKMLGEVPQEEEEEEPSEPQDVIMDRYTRKYSYTGPCRIFRQVTVQEKPKKRLFIEVERARELKLFIDDVEIPPFVAPSLATPQVFEVTGKMNGTHVVTFLSDNSYPSLPTEEIRSSNMANPDTQTNWNGLLGYVRLREEKEIFIESIRVLPRGMSLSVHVEISAPFACESLIRLTSPVLERQYITPLHIKEGYSSYVLEGLELRENTKRWSEGKGNLTTLTAELQNGERKMVTFGVRDFRITENHKFSCNGQTVFLRGETSCGIHPDTSYLPMDKNSWLKILKQYQSYGANFVRFASHCPPEAAFQAADELGMFFLVGLSCHQHKGAYETEKAQNYYRIEAAQILKTYANHPSFVMMSFGSGAETLNSLSDYLRDLLTTAKKMDPSRLYTPGANVISEESDFLLADHREYLPDRMILPVITSREGMYEIVQDFTEIDLFSGVLLPLNLDKMRENVERAGLTTTWKKYVEASGECALSRYKKEIEQHYLDERIAGLSLVSLTDMPGHGRPPIGMMNTHLVPKQYDFASPLRFRQFFAPQAVLMREDRCTYSYGETAHFEFYVMNYGAEPLEYPLRLTVSSGEKSVQETFERTMVIPGEVKKVGECEVGLSHLAEGVRRGSEMHVRLRFGLLENDYPIYVYRSVVPICPESVLETDRLDEKAISYLNNGGNVFLTPSVRGGASKGSRYFDETHPIFNGHLTKRGEDLSWENIPGRFGFTLPRRYKNIIMKLRQPRKVEPFVQLFEARVLNGSILVSSLGLKENIKRPEAASLLQAIYDYMDSYEFSPNQELLVSELRLVLDTLREEDSHGV